MLNNEKILEIKKRAANKWASHVKLQNIKGPMTSQRLIDLYKCEAVWLLEEENRRKLEL